MFITLEGIEGSGKSTLAQRLAEGLRARGRSVVLTREPGGSELGKSLRALLLNPGTRTTPAAELFLFLADRAQHVADVIRPALQRGDVVICDRFADSTLAYQGMGRGLAASAADQAILLQLNELAIQHLWPDVTLLLDLPPEVGLARARSRDAAMQKTDAEGRFEAEELAFHRRIRQGFLDLASANPQRIKVLDAQVPPKALAQAAAALLRF